MDHLSFSPVKYLLLQVGELYFFFKQCLNNDILLKTAQSEQCLSLCTLLAVKKKKKRT